MKYDTKSFCEDLKSLGLELHKEQIDQFVSYYEVLTKWNGFMNLTAITGFEEVCKKHFTDSISLLLAKDNISTLTGTDFSRDSLKVIDVGTGAGFPGIPLKIVFPHLEIVLLDSLNKRVNFLNQVIADLGLKGITSVHGRAEDFGKDRAYREGFDICVSRAVADLAVLAECCIPFVKKGGVFVSYKSDKIEDELSRAKNAFSALGGRFCETLFFTLPDSGQKRSFVIIQKETETPDRYPRKAGIPFKKPMS